MAITSQARASLLGEVAISDWKAAGLLKPSVIKPVITTIDHSLIISKFGKLVDADENALRAALPAIFG
jgi:mRNA interferase MazF